MCDKCIKKLQSSLPHCPCCLRLSTRGVLHNSCRSLLQSLISIYKYTPEAKVIVKAIKYEGSKRLIDTLIDRNRDLIRYIFTNRESIYLIPVPLYRYKELDRGFNQAEIIANWIHRITGIPILKIVDRNRNTRPQNKLNKGERVRNIEDSFIIKCKLDRRVREVILIDDIVTSQSTLLEVARTIKRESPQIIINSLVLFDAQRIKKVVDKERIKT